MPNTTFKVGRARARLLGAGPLAAGNRRLPQYCIAPQETGDAVEEPLKAAAQYPEVGGHAWRAIPWRMLFPLSLPSVGDDSLYVRRAHTDGSPESSNTPAAGNEDTQHHDRPRGV